GGSGGEGVGGRGGYSARKVAPMPKTQPKNPAHPPMKGMLVTTRTATTPTTTRRKNGQNSSSRPINHWPTMPPTTTSAAISIMPHNISEERPTNRPTTVTHAISEARRTPKKTSTPSPNDAPT